MTITATEILDRLRKRWPDAEYMNIREAPQDSMRQGRKIDLLVLSLWNSRGHERDAVEIKVSGSDWKRELDKPEKADWWYHRCHRFWVAVPGEDATLVKRVKGELPESWGLLAVGPDSTRSVVPAPKHKPEDFTLSTWIGITRAAADAGVNALNWARQQGYEQGVERGRQEGRPDPVAHDQRLREAVAEFKEATGVDVMHPYPRATELIRMAKLVFSYQSDPDYITRAVERMSKQLRGEAKQLEAIVKELQGLQDVELPVPSIPAPGRSGAADEEDGGNDQQDDNQDGDHPMTLPLGSCADPSTGETPK